MTAGALPTVVPRPRPFEPRNGVVSLNGAPIEDRTAFGRVVARRLLGPAATASVDGYDELGGLILPVENDRKARHYASTGSRSVPEAFEASREHPDRLRSHRSDGTVRFPAAPGSYVDCFEWLIRRADYDGRGVTEA